MKNITITLDDETAALARVAAARENVSLSRFIGNVLRERMQEAREYDRAMRRYLSSTLTIRRRPDERFSRDELHDRGALRTKRKGG